MKLVNNNDKKLQRKDLNYLHLRKVDLQEKIRLQEQQISSSIETAFSPAAFTKYVINFFSKSFNILDSVVIGYKIIRSFRQLFKH